MGGFSGSHSEEEAPLLKDWNRQRGDQDSWWSLWSPHRGRLPAGGSAQNKTAQGRGGTETALRRLVRVQARLVWVLVPRDAGAMSLPRVSPAPPAPAHSHSRSADGAPLQPWVAAHIPATSGLHRSVRILTETRADVSDVSLRLCFLRNAALPEGNGSRFLELEMAGVITSAPSEQPPGSL